MIVNLRILYHDVWLLTKPQKYANYVVSPFKIVTILARILAVITAKISVRRNLCVRFGRISLALAGFRSPFGGNTMQEEQKTKAESKSSSILFNALAVLLAVFLVTIVAAQVATCYLHATRPTINTPYEEEDGCGDKQPQQAVEDGDDDCIFF
jgi:hypothetical protein